MDNLFFLPPGSFDLSRLPPRPARITIRRVGGEQLEIDPREAEVSLTSEHPQVERMEGDWGAICEVFRDSSYYYAAISGIRLETGDEVRLDYGSNPGLITLKVIDLENGRARVDPPHIMPPGAPPGAPNGGQQNP
jgi:hypothetical protein